MAAANRDCSVLDQDRCFLQNNLNEILLIFYTLTMRESEREYVCVCEREMKVARRNKKMNFYSFTNRDLGF